MAIRRLLGHKRKQGRIGRALLVAAAVSAATMMAIAAPAQAAWEPPKTVDAHCSGYSKIFELWVQECVVVNRHANGAWVQSILAVENRTGGSRRVRGETTTWIDETKRLSFTNCGDQTIAAGDLQWCWGVTTNVIGHGRSVWGSGVLYDYKYGLRVWPHTPEPDPLT